MPFVIFIFGIMTFIGAYPLAKRVKYGPDMNTIIDYVEVIVCATVFCAGMVGLVNFGVAYIIDHFPCIKVI